MNENLTNTKKVSTFEKIKKRIEKIAGYLGILLALIPVALFFFCKSQAKDGTEDGTGAVWWILVIYFFTIGFPVVGSSIGLGIMGLKNKNKIPSYVTFIIHIGIILTVAAFYLKYQ